MAHASDSSDGLPSDAADASESTEFVWVDETDLVEPARGRGRLSAVTDLLSRFW